MTNLTLTDQLILTLFKELNYQSDCSQEVPKTFVQKLLFKLQTNFPDDINLMNSIPYYWYNHGPFSEIVQEELDNLVRLGFLEFVENHRNCYYILKNYNFKLEESKDYQDDISDLLRKYSVFDLNELVDDVYYNFAPYDFVPLYKRKTLEPLKIEMRDVTTNEEFQEKINLDNLIELLYDCESELPFDKIFCRYSEFFSNFTTTLDNLYDEINLDTFNQTFTLIDNAWYTFAKALRIVKHDNFQQYIKKEMLWKSDYRRELSKSEVEANKLSLIDRVRYNESNLHYSPNSRKLLISTVGKYISE